MHKVIIAGPKSYLEHKDENSKMNAIELIKQTKKENVVFQIAILEELDDKDLVLISKMLESQYNRLVLLNKDVKTFFDYRVSCSRIVFLESKSEQDAFNKVQQYINLPSFYDSENVKEGDLKLHHDGTEDLIIKAPKFTEKEPEFNEVDEAEFSSELQRVTKYSYYFGIDEIEICKSNINKECCYISDYINIGEMKENDYIQIDADYFLDENTSIEFFIVDGEKEIPILPYKENFIQNEKIFLNSLTRFIINKNKPYYIYKNLSSTNLKIEEAITKNDGLYTISYEPIESHEYKPINSTIQIKVIMRMYDKTKQPPFINYINIRKFGDEMVWKDNI